MAHYIHDANERKQFQIQSMINFPWAHKMKKSLALKNAMQQPFSVSRIATVNWKDSTKP